MKRQSKSPNAKYIKSDSAKERYCNLFQHSPISIWEEDFSEVKTYLDNLKKKGVINFRKYFASYPEEVLSLAQKVKIIAVNEATLKMFQAKSEEELYRGLNQVFNKESYDVFREELIALSEGKTEFYSEAVNRTLKGELRNILLKAIVLPGYEDTLSNLFIYIIDISNLKRLEENLKESEEKYRKIVETAHDGILLVDTDTGIILEANKKAEDLIGLSASEIVGMHFSDLYPEKNAVQYKKLFNQHIIRDRYVSENLVMCRKSGDKIPVTISSSTLEIRGKKCISAIFRQMNREGNKFNDIMRTDKPAYQITQRESEVLKFIASGLTAKQIAKQLYVSERTITTHRARIMQKLNIHKSAELVRYAMAYGLLNEGATELK